jgi:hypothetical protein
MIALENTPDDIEEWAKLPVDFPFLSKNTVEECPISMEDIQNYLSLEDADFDSVEFRELTFLRTAKVAEQNYWIWKYNESDGTECYVTVSSDAEGSTVTGMDSNNFNLSPEQFMLATHYCVL